ncbi:uncharacterized protein LOC110117405 [Athalia rosae]|uniref:uncharacterized protein LOC110117405 n=1 Tax=Athalia rosae TaxID=37344 RepID=UPI002033AB70|nr:uncharacterized protein LOC110117405 [Athalia rosae]
MPDNIDTSAKYFGKISENDDPGVLECLVDLINGNDWRIKDFVVIYGSKNIFFDYDLIEKYPYFAWKLYSVKKLNLQGTSNVILFTDNFDSFKETINVINVKPMDSRTKYVVILTENFASLDAIHGASMDIPTILWKLDKVRVIFLVPCRADIFAMTYFPFVNNCGVSELQTVDTWRKESGFEKQIKLFPKKMFDGQGCVRYTAFTTEEGMVLEARREFSETGEAFLGGIGGRLLTIIAEKMNTTLQLDPRPTKTWKEMIDQVKRGKTFAMVGGMMPEAYYLEHFDLSSTYNEVSFGIGYSTKGLEISWKNLLWPLSNESWAYTGVSCLLFFGLIILANRFLPSKNQRDKTRLLDGFGIFLGTSRAMPKSCFRRYLFGMWIIYSYLINAAYNTKLFSFLTTSRPKRVIDTFEQLLDDGIEFGGNQNHKDYYYDPSDPLMMKIYDNFQIWSRAKSEPCLWTPTCATGIMSSTAYMYNSHQYGNIEYQIRTLKDKTFTFYVPISLRRGSPFVPGVHRYTLQAVQSGFVNYWMRHYTRKPGSSGLDHENFSKITVEHIRGILVLHSVGMVLSSLVFIGEYISRYK